jgi:cysteine desulfurase/selenocysteine lyase
VKTRLGEPPAALRAARPAAFDVERIRRDFPILSQTTHGKPLVYLDNVNTSQKPRCVIDALVDYYSRYNANVHRGAYDLSMQATDAYERARLKVHRFMGAADPSEIVFVRGTTEAINLAAQCFGGAKLGPGDEVLISGMEHHSNIVPWQLACQQAGATLRVIPITDEGELRMDELKRLLGPRTRLAAVAHVSNALGTINPIKEIVSLCHKAGAVVLVDGAQSVPHFRVNVAELGCDFFAFSGHKLFGPMGIGVLYARRDLLDSLPPYHGGGNMIRTVTFEKTTYADPPFRYEAGTPNVADAIGLGAAIDYLEDIGMEAIEAYEQELLSYATGRLGEVPGLRILGTAARKAPVISFLLDEIHAHDVSTILDLEGVAVRAGHHCAQPVMDRYGVPAAVRASFAFYNTRQEIDILVSALNRVVEVFQV